MDGPLSIISLAYAQGPPDRQKRLDADPESSHMCVSPDQERGDTCIGDYLKPTGKVGERTDRARGLTEEKLNQHFKSIVLTRSASTQGPGSGRRCDCDPSTSYRPASQSSSGAYSSWAFAIPRNAERPTDTSRRRWMGGVVPFGYDVCERQIVVNQTEAEIVTYIFRRYGKLGCVRLLRENLNRMGIVSKQRTSDRGIQSGGRPFSRGALYALLSNPIYVGEIRHKDLRHPGQHEAMLDRELWNAPSNSDANGQFATGQRQLSWRRVRSLDGCSTSAATASRRATRAKANVDIAITSRGTRQPAPRPKGRSAFANRDFRRELRVTGRKMDLVSGRAASIVEIGKREGVGKRYVSRMIRLAFLAPAIVERIAEGRQPPELTAQFLSTGRGDLPLS